MVLFVPLTEIERLLTERTGFTSTEETYVVGPDRLMRSSSRFHSTPTSLTLTVDTDAVRRALAGESGTIQQRDYRNVAVLSSFAPVSFAGVTWAILAEIDIDEVLIPARALRLRIFWLFAALTFAAGALLVFVLRRVVLAPIGTLTQAARRIERGDYDHPVALDTADELGQLGRVVDTMMGSVRASLHTTQARLAESQIDLRQVAERLNTVREQERSRLARDVHDQIGQALTAFKMDVAEVRRRLGRADYAACRAVDEMSALATRRSRHAPARDQLLRRSTMQERSTPCADTCTTTRAAPASQPRSRRMSPPGPPARRRFQRIAARRSSASFRKR
jgi:methyl-accepting chemotaxis protein